MALDAAAAGHWLRLLHRIPRIGTPIAHLLEDLRLYRHRMGALLVASLITVVVHSCSSISFYLVARGCPATFAAAGHSLRHRAAEHLQRRDGRLPVGPMEFVLEFFYTPPADVRLDRQRSGPAGRAGRPPRSALSWRVWECSSTWGTAGSWPKRSMPGRRTRAVSGRRSASGFSCGRRGCCSC